MILFNFFKKFTTAQRSAAKYSIVLTPDIWIPACHYALEDSRIDSVKLNFTDIISMLVNKHAIHSQNPLKFSAHYSKTLIVLNLNLKKLRFMVVGV